MSSSLVAIGVGTSAALFTVWQSLTAAGLPYPAADRLVVLQAGGRSWSPAMLESVRASLAVFDEIAGVQERAAALDSGDLAQIVRLESVSASYFALLGARPARGRTFSIEEDRRDGNAAVAIMSHDLWRRRGADSDVIGTRLVVDGVPLTVIGVLDEGFRGLIGRTDLWTPLGSARWLNGDTGPERPGSRWFEVFGRLRPETPMAAAQAQYAAEARAAILQIPGGDRIAIPAARFDLIPLADARVTRSVRDGVEYLAAGGAVLLVLITVTVALLHLMRAQHERRDLAIRLSLGARPSWLIASASADVLRIIGAGALGAIGVRTVVLTALAGVEPPATTFGIPSARLLPDSSMATTLATVGVIAAVATASMVPVLVAAWWRGQRISLEAALRRESHEGSGLRRIWNGRLLLLCAQTTVACAVLSAGVLIARGAASVIARHRGYDTSGIVTAQLALPRHYDAVSVRSLFDRAIEELRRLPGAASVSVANCVPGAGRCRQSNVSSVDGVPLDHRTQPAIGLHFMTPRHLRTLGARLSNGRAFSEADRVGAPLVAVVSAPLAGGLWPGQNPIGRTLEVFTANGSLAGQRAVIGVIDPVAFDADNDRGFDVFLPAAQAAWSSGVIFVRTQTPEAVLRDVARVVSSLDRQVALTDAGPIDRTLLQTIAMERFLRNAMLGFGGAAVLIAAIGVFALVTQLVVRSRRELALRAALGATGRDLASLTAGRGAWLVAVSSICGVAAAFWTARGLSTLLHGLPPHDAVALASGPLITTLCIATAIAGPAWRAAGVNAAAVLRGDE